MVIKNNEFSGTAADTSSGTYFWVLSCTPGVVRVNNTRAGCRCSSEREYEPECGGLRIL